MPPHSCVGETVVTVGQEVVGPAVDVGTVVTVGHHTVGQPVGGTVGPVESGHDRPVCPST